MTYVDKNVEQRPRRKIINPPFIIESLLNLALMSLSSNQPSEAKGYYIKALAIARHSGSTALEVKPLLGLSSLAFECKDYKQARDFYRQAYIIAQNSTGIGVKSEINLYQQCNN